MHRPMDLTLAGLSLAVSSPLLAVLAVAIKLDSPGPVIFTQERMGKDCKPFRCLKFRTMHDGAEGMAWTLENDPRVTRVGRWLRAMHLDEIPQLVNVLMGEMSIVGPRPLVEQEIVLFGALDHPYNKRFSVLPGITGLAQVSVAPDAHLTKFRLDAFYVEHQSTRLDLIIMLRTAQKLFRLDGARQRERRQLERSQA